MVEALYTEGENYSTADRFVWTLPDRNELAPGANTSDYGYQAKLPMVGKANTAE